jgi:hypothetical protein
VKSTPSKSKSSAKAAPKVVKKNASATQAPLDHVATAAYYNAEARGFEPGRELDDWLQAEAKFNTWKGL